MLAYLWEELLLKLWEGYDSTSNTNVVTANAYKLRSDYAVSIYKIRRVITLTGC